MTFLGIVLGIEVFMFGVFPKSFGRHLAEVVKAYRTALETKEGRGS